MSDYKLQRVKLDKLIHVFDVRVKLNEDWIITLGQMYESGKEMEPIDINEKLIILNGRHRVQGAALAGCEFIMARVHKNLDGKNALLFSMHANEGGALPLTVNDYAMVVKELLKLGQTESQICHDMKLPSRFLRSIITNQRKNLSNKKMSLVHELLAKGKTIKEASKETGITEKSIQHSLHAKGTIENSLYNKLTSLVSRQRNSLMAFMRRTEERMKDDLHEGLITHEEIVTVWQRTRDMLQSAQIKLNDYESRKQ